MQKLKIFVSYSHHDEGLRADVERHLSILKRNNLIDIWCDRKITAGTEFEEEIYEKLIHSDIILLLVSSYFIDSNYCFDIEMTEAIKLHDEGKAVVVPIILSECNWHKAPFGKLMALPTDGQPINGKNWHSKDEALTVVASGIEKVVNELNEKRSVEKTTVSEIILSPVTVANKLINYPTPKPYFTGRNKEIEDFKKAISEKNTFITVDGPGGIGKTQFISRCIEKFIPKEKVIWYECSTASQLDTLISEAGYPEFLKGNSKTDREKFSAFKDKIEENEFYLFLDNFQETNSNAVFKEFLIFIQQYLKKGCVIVIDRDDIRSVNLTPKRIHITGFKENKLDYAKALISYSYQNDVNVSNAELEKLCDQLQGYPLAIDFAVLLLSEGISASDIITKIVQERDVEQISERLLNAIFSRPDATVEEKEFLTQFSAFTGSVSEDVIKSLVPTDLFEAAHRRLQKKNLLSLLNGNYEIHPLVREFCYNKLENKVDIHYKIAEFFITQRTTGRSPALEEQIFYHLLRSEQWDRIEKEIEENGRRLILSGQLGLVKELLDRLKIVGIVKPIFDILYGDISEMHGKWDEAQKYFDQARVNVGSKEIKAEGMIKYAEMLHRKGHIKEAIILYEEANVYSHSNNLLKEEARSLNDLGLVNQWLGNLDIAHKKLQDALKIRQYINDKKGVGSSLFNISNLFHIKGEQEEALININNSLKIYEDIHDNHGIAMSFIVIGNILDAKGRSDDALIKYKQGLEIAEVIGNKSIISAAKASIGNIFLTKGKLEEAMQIYEDSLKINLEIGNKQELAVVFNNIGNVYLEQGNIEDAIINVEKSLTIKKEIDDVSGIASSYHSLGVLYADKSKKLFDLSIKYFFKSYSLNNKLGRKLDLKYNINWIIQLRDSEIGLHVFRVLACNIYKKLSPDVQKYIPLNEFLKEPVHHKEPKTGRNDPCPCGSGKKYKQCHGLGN